ncbi:MAG: hypothetical protein ACTSVF_03625 [Candidatus Asgardarchaeia archaeon]
MRQKSTFRGSLFVDTMTSFLLILLVFIISVKMSLIITEKISNEANDNSQTISKIARSYEVLRKICPHRDNEVDIVKISDIENINLYSQSFGAPTHHTYCIRRGVYILQTDEVAVLEVC